MQNPIHLNHPADLSVLKAEPAPIPAYAQWSGTTDARAYQIYLDCAWICITNAEVALEKGTHRGLTTMDWQLQSIKYARRINEFEASPAAAGAQEPAAPPLGPEPAAQPMRRIEPGQTLSARSVCDHDCIFTVEVLARNGSFVTVRAQGETKRVKVHADNSGEFIFALGRYSMAPIFRAPTTTN